jgi:hypothetical protein
MSQVIDFFEQSVRTLFIERRGFARRAASLAVSLPVGVSIPNEKLDPEMDEYPNPVMGRTRDLSETGLSLFLPSLKLGHQQISPSKFPLRLVLSLPDGIAVVQVVVVRTEETVTPENERGFVIGARIKKMSERDRKRYLALLKSLIDSYL